MYEPPSALQLPSLEGNAPAADAAVSSESETVLEPPAALEVPSLEPGQPQSVDPEPPTELQPAPGPAAAGAVLEVTLADGATVRVELAEGRHDVGRAPDCAVYIDDRTLSRCHARVTVGSDGVTIEDQDSRNGTFMDGERLTGSVGLRIGDVVTFGDQVTARLVEP